MATYCLLDGISVENARFKMGEKLATTIKAELGPERLAQVDVVIPIPETSNTSARAVAKHLGKELASGFVKVRDPNLPEDRTDQCHRIDTYFGLS